MAEHHAAAGRTMTRSLGLAIAFAILALPTPSFADVIIYKKVDKASHWHCACENLGPSAPTANNPPPPPPPPRPTLTMPQNNFAMPTHSLGVSLRVR